MPHASGKILRNQTVNTSPAQHMTPRQLDALELWMIEITSTLAVQDSGPIPASFRRDILRAFHVFQKEMRPESEQSKDQP